MSAQIFNFPRKETRDPDRVANRDADEHLLVAMRQRDRMLDDATASKLFIDYACVFSGIDGLAHYLTKECPTMTNAGLGEYLSTALTHYRTRVLGLVE